MSNPENPTETSVTEMQKSVSAKSARHIDYAAWVDSDGREHAITPNMVDELIADMVSGADYSLQGRTATLNLKRNPIRYLQNRPR
jgi:hypothetical protein